MSGGEKRRLMEDLRRDLESLEYLTGEAKKIGGEYSEGAALGYESGARRLRQIIEEYA